MRVAKNTVKLLDLEARTASSSATLDTDYAEFAVLYVNLTAIGALDVEVSVCGLDSSGNEYVHSLLTSLSGTGRYPFYIGPGVTTPGLPIPVPRHMKILMDHSGPGSATYSLEVELS